MSFPLPRRVVLARRLGVAFRSVCSSVNFSDKRVVIPLPRRSYLQVHGRDALSFLQGITTNDMRLLESEQQCIASAILNPKGRVVADLFIYDITAEDDEHKRVLIEVHNGQLKAVQQYLTLYKLRSKIKITTKNDDYKTYFSPLKSDMFPEMAPELGDSNTGNEIVVTDPRVEGFGTRILSSRPAHTSVSPVLNGADCFLGPAKLYDTYRMLWGLGEGVDLEGKIPLEVNLDFTNYVSFTKGCYLGQELTARTKYKGIVRKRLLPFLLCDQIADGDSSTPDLPSVLCESNNIKELPLFQEMSNFDEESLLKYYQVCENREVRADRIPRQKIRRENGENDAVWSDDDDSLVQWNKLRIFCSMKSTTEDDVSAKLEERTIGKVISVDDIYNQHRFRLGLGLINLSSLSAGNGAHDFNLLNEKYGGWRIPLQVIRPKWWVDVDSLTGQTVIPVQEN